MPSTPIFGWPFEAPADQPGTSLTGGPLGTEPILAEEIETDVAALAADVADHGTRLDLLEAGTSMVGWVPIQAANSTGADFDIDLTDGGRFAVGEFALVRLHMRYDLSDEGSVAARINNDQGGGTAYSSAQRGVDAANADELGVDRLESEAAANRWLIGWGATVSTNNLICTFFHMNGNFNHNFQSTSNRQSTSATTTLWVESWGALTSALSAAPSTIRIFPPAGGVTFVNAFWWAEGYRVPA